MLKFVNDYCEGAHPAILQRMNDNNFNKMPGYGEDEICESAKRKIREACRCENADVYFLVGGTQTNSVVIDSLLDGYEGVIAASTGHINVHESGAIEATGHKVIALGQNNGKVSAADIADYAAKFYADESHEHMVFPGMVYISQPTEYGTLYSYDELKALSDVCGEYSMKLYVDGARLGYALACPDNNVSLEQLASLADVFYIGGTKVGALFGEAVVFTKNNAPKHFVARIKRRGALIAKGWLLGIQFDTLFTDGLYTKIAKNAIETAQIIKETLKNKGYSFFVNSPTNQIFVILDNEKLAELRNQVNFEIWEVVDAGHTAVRFVTSWATPKEEAEAFANLL